ncbi:MAG: Crp/Fnr family transcriptional regulator [Sciscionella sp.]
MKGRENPPAAIGQMLRLLGGNQRDADAQVRQAAWVARCVGRGDTAPLLAADVSALASILRILPVARGASVFAGGEKAPGVWIVREGQVELSVGSGRRRVVVHVLRPGDVDGDIPLLLDMPLPYTARALTDVVCLFLHRADFESMLAGHPAIARRWLSSVAGRLATSQARILGLLGRSLSEQVARLLLDEAIDRRVPLPQRTLAAMLGVQRPSLNKILKQLESEGALAVRYAAVEIVDPAALARRAG